jgi:hypothetical protein
MEVTVTMTQVVSTKNSKLSCNVSPELLQQLDALVKMHGPFARRHAIHVAALRIGLAELAGRPERLLEVLRDQG